MKLNQWSETVRVIGTLFLPATIQLDRAAHCCEEQTLTLPPACLLALFALPAEEDEDVAVAGLYQKIEREVASRAKELAVGST